MAGGQQLEGHSPVSNQGWEVWGRVSCHQGNRRGPGSEGGEALARVDAAQALREQGLSEGAPRPPRPPQLPELRATPCWRSWLGSAASLAACPSRRTWGAEGGVICFTEAGIRDPVSDTEVPLTRWVGHSHT